MNLYQEIILLKYYCKIKWTVENVKPYYEPLIKAQKCGRHLFWSNFIINKMDFETKFNLNNHNPSFLVLQKLYGIDIEKYNLSSLKDKRVILKNMIEPYLGLHILNESKRNIQPELFV